MCQFRQKRLSYEEFILKLKKKIIFEASPATLWAAPGTDSIGLEPFQPLILNHFKTETAFILAYCISLYVSADRPFMHLHTGKENIPDNLIHSGSSCNVGAAQQVVLWCLSLVSKISVLISSELSCMGRKHNLENTSLSHSPKSLTVPPPQPGHAHICVFAICGPWADVL